MEEQRSRDTRQMIYTVLSFAFFVAQLVVTILLAVEIHTLANSGTLAAIAIIVLLPASLVVGAVGAILTTVFASLARRRLRVVPPAEGGFPWRVVTKLLQILPFLAYIAVEAITIVMM